MLRLGEERELSQLDVDSFQKKLGLNVSPETGDQIMKVAQTVKGFLTKKSGTPQASAAPPKIAPTSTGIGVLPILVGVAGLGILAFVFFFRR